MDGHSWYNEIEGIQIKFSDLSEPLHFSLFIDRDSLGLSDCSDPSEPLGNGMPAEETFPVLAPG
eukprot:692866-Hanusia_phi.AAC.1